MTILYRKRFEYKKRARFLQEKTRIQKIREKLIKFCLGVIWKFFKKIPFNYNHWLFNNCLPALSFSCLRISARKTGF